MEELKLKFDVVMFTFSLNSPGRQGKSHIFNIISAVLGRVFVPLVNIPFCHIPKMYSSKHAFAYSWRFALTFHFNHSFSLLICTYLLGLHYMYLNLLK